MHVKRYCNIRDNYNFLGMAGQDVRGYMCLPRHVLKWPDIFISMYTHKTWSTVMHIEHMYMYVTHVLSILIVPEVENEMHASICLKTIATISSSLLLKSVVIKILYKWQHFNLPRKSFLWHVSIKLVKRFWLNQMFYLRGPYLRRGDQFQKRWVFGERDVLFCHHVAHIQFPSHPCLSCSIKRRQRLAYDGNGKKRLTFRFCTYALQTPHCY